MPPLPTLVIMIFFSRKHLRMNRRDYFRREGSTRQKKRGDAKTSRNFGNGHLFLHLFYMGGISALCGRHFCSANG